MNHLLRQQPSVLPRLSAYPLFGTVYLFVGSIVQSIAVCNMPGTDGKIAACRKSMTQTIVSSAVCTKLANPRLALRVFVQFETR
jgi:hypothetical protein